MVEGKFDLLKVISESERAIVYEAKELATKELVAVKKLKRTFNSWDQAMALHEIKCLIQVKHPNVLKLKEVIRGTQMRELYLVYEYIFTNLEQIMDMRRKIRHPFKEPEIKYII